MIPHSRPWIDVKAKEVVLQLLERGWLTQGAEVRALEQALEAAYPGSRAAAVSSGTAALFLILRAWNIGPGREVLIPAFTCNSVRAAVAMTGARPVPVDAAPHSLTISPVQARRCQTARTAALIAVHQFGYEADIPGLLELGLPVIEDCAHAPAARGRDGTLLGTRGHAAVLSFYATKLVPGGEGGAVISRDPELIAAVTRLRNCDSHQPPSDAFNFVLSDIHAALARIHFAALPSVRARRRFLAKRYDRDLGQWALETHPRFRAHRACFFRYLLVLEKDDVDRVIGAARERGVACARPVRVPLHRLLGGNCPQTEWLQAHLLSVPCYPALSDSEANTVCSTLSTILSA